MKYLVASSILSASFWLLQSGVNFENFQNIADKYGVPAAFSLVMFIYFSRQASKAEKLASDDRAEIRASNEKQVQILEKVLAQNIISNNNYCKFNDIHNKEGN